MSTNFTNNEIFSRNKVAYYTLILSSIAISILAIAAIIKGDGNTAMTIFNTTLPVFASWIGTVLAFYFGRENFESANQQVKQMVQRLTPEQKAQKSVESIMYTPYAMTIFKIPDGQKVEEIKMSELKEKLTTYKASRLPIVDAQNRILYMIHESKINKYLMDSTELPLALTLGKFLEDHSERGYTFQEDDTFVIVPQNISIDQAKTKLQECGSHCKDIFVTQSGSQDEPMIGWIPNVHLLEYLQV